MYTPSLVIKKTVEGYPFEEFIYCGCKCGLTRPKYDKRGRIGYIIKGHFWVGKNMPSHTEEWKQLMREKMKGRIFSKEWREKISLGLKGKCMGEYNHNWKGDEVGYNALHERIRRRLPKPKVCQLCNIIPPYDIANISGKYLLDLSDWLWLCRSCHKIFDIRYKSPEERRVFIDNFLSKI